MAAATCADVGARGGRHGLHQAVSHKVRQSPLASEGAGGLQAAPPGGRPRQPGIRSRMVKC